MLLHSLKKKVHMCGIFIHFGVRALHILNFLIKEFARFLLFLISFNLDRANVFAHFSKMPGSSNMKFRGVFRKGLKIIHVKFHDLVMHGTGVI